MPVRETSRAIVIPRELFRKSTLAYSRPIKSRSCQKLPTPQSRNRGSSRRRVESQARRVGLMNNSLAWSFPCFGGSPQDGDASPARQEMFSTPCEDQGWIGQSAWQERGPSPVVSRIQRRHDRHFRPFLPIAVQHDVPRSRDNDFVVTLRNSADTLCRHTAAQRLHDANTARQASRQTGYHRPPRRRNLGEHRIEMYTTN